MSELKTPLRDKLAPALRDADARRLWQVIDARRAARSQGAPVWRAALAGAVLAASLLVMISIWPAGARGKALALADGCDLFALEISPGSADDTALSDGSHIARDPGARLRVLENTGSVIDMLLEDGRVRFHVQKGGPRRWVVECGLLSAEVVGTHFVVERDSAHARVEVIEGAVLVRGERVPDRVKRIEAGESLEVQVEAKVSAPIGTPVRGQGAEPSPPSPPTPAARATSSALPLMAAPQAPANTSAWRDLAKAAAYDRAYLTLGDGGIAKMAAGASVDVLLELADVARLSGHPNEAIAPLTEIADRHATDPRAPLAAFTLGRVLLDRAPALASQRFEQAIAGGLPVSLVEDAMALVVEARARAGDRSGAEAAAARYESAYPNGRRREAVRGWASPR